MNPELAQTPHDLQQLQRLLAEATAAIAPDYFLLPVANAGDAEPLLRYRERVYAYELYHQLRSNWPDAWPYSLAGEIDKGGHPIVRGGLLDSAKPDLLVHIPGKMDSNLAVIEIKPFRARGSTDERERFQRDIQKLVAFRRPPARYALAIFLVFGNGIERAQGYGRDLQQGGTGIDEVQLWHHPGSGQHAAMAPW